VPRLGIGFLTDTAVLAVFGVFILLCIYETSSYIKTLKMKTFFVFGFLGIFAVLFLMLSWYGYVTPLSFKFISVLNPSARLGTGTLQQLVQSVQEHRPAAWGTFYYDFGIGVFFVIVGLFFAVQNPTNRNLFLCIFGLTSIYFAGSMVRLTLLMAPALCLLFALGLVRMLRPFITIMKETPAIPRRKMHLGGHVGKEFSWAFILMTFLLLTFNLVLPSPKENFPRTLTQAYSPTTIAAGSMPLGSGLTEPVTDWLNALNWMRVNLKSTDVVAAWWDYGYWITIIANKTTLADNGTFNSTQIAQIGKMFMSNETEAIKILDRFGATYVVVFVTFQTDSEGNPVDVGWGDEGKWRWMARIAGLNDVSFGNYSLGKDGIDTNGDGSVDQTPDNPKGQNTVIYKLMQYGKEMTLHSSSTIQLEYFEGPPGGYFSQEMGNPKSYRGVIPLVCVYKINYI